MAQSGQVALHSDISISECLNRISNAIDTPRWTVFSLSGYQGSRPVLGKIEGDRIRLEKRRYYRNSFAPYFYATLSEQEHGTRIEGHFDSPPLVKVFMRIWFVFVVAIGIPIFILSLKDIFLKTDTGSGDPIVGVLVPPVLIVFGILLPKIGRWFARSEEGFILNFLQRILPARLDMSPQEYKQRCPSSIDLG
jgi:hypothetical protein